MIHKTKWTAKYLLGYVDKEPIYLRPPSWDCGWYWGFGYLGNNNYHYHLDAIGKSENINFRDALLKHFDAGTSIFRHDGLTWVFCELVLTAYQLKATAEMLGRGGSHITTNPCASIIKDEAYTKHINEIVLPAVFDKIADTLRALQEHNAFLNDKGGNGFIVTDGYHNLTLDLMTWDEVQAYIAHQKKGGFDTSRIRVSKIKPGELFKDAKGGELVKHYDILTGVCRCLLGNSIFTKEAIEAFEKKIIEYRAA